MTEQQRTAHIEFVKKLLVANGFTEAGKTKFYKFLVLENVDFEVKVLKRLTTYEIYPGQKMTNPHDQPLKPLRDFIKLSNQK